MTRQEKLILLVVTLLVLTRIGDIAREMLIAMVYGASGPTPVDKHLWVAASNVWNGLVNVGAAVWLFVEARTAALKSWVWSLFGLCFGILGVVLFYLVLLYTKGAAQKS